MRVPQCNLYDKVITLKCLEESANFRYVLIGWLVFYGVTTLVVSFGWVLWHINHRRLFNAKSPGTSPSTRLSPPSLFPQRYILYRHRCCMYVLASRPVFARPCEGDYGNMLLMSSSLLLQQCLACLVRLTWMNYSYTYILNTSFIKTFYRYTWLNDPTILFLTIQFSMSQKVE